MSWQNPSTSDVAEALVDTLEERAGNLHACTDEACRKAWKQTAQLLFEDSFKKFNWALTELRDDKKELEAKLAEARNENVRLRAQVPAREGGER